MRTLERARYDMVKAATRRLVRACGGVEAAATDTRVNKSQLSCYGSLDHPESFAPIDVVMDLENACGQDIVTRVMSAAPGSAVVTETDPLRLAAIIGAELGEAQAAALEAARDGEIDNGELEAVIKEFEDVMRAATRGHDELCRLRAARRECADLNAARRGHAAE